MKRATSGGTTFTTVTGANGVSDITYADVNRQLTDLTRWT